MATSMHDLGIDRLNADERLNLMHEIWDSLNAEPAHTYLNEGQRRELERRLAEHAADPTDVVPWGQVKAEALARLQER